jgi:hypothetical protein
LSGYKKIPNRDLSAHLETVTRLDNMGENSSAKLLLMDKALCSFHLKGITLPTTLITQSE